MDTVYFFPIGFFYRLQCFACYQSSRDCLYLSCMRFAISCSLSLVLIVLLLVFVGFVFLTYFCNFPCHIKVFTWSFKCLHSSVRCLWPWWNLQYLLLSLLSIGVLIGFGHCKEGLSLICIRTYLIGIIRGVKLVNFGFQFGSSFFFPMVCLTLRVSFFLL